MKHLRTLFDVTAEDVQTILSLAADLKTRLTRGQRPSLLQNHVLTLLFEKPSLRTRNSFESAMMQLGGGSIFLTGQEAGFNGREALADIARVLSRYSDLIVMRTFSQQLVDDFAAHAACPVVNGLSDGHHPCQALTDVFTIREVLGDLQSRKLAYIGDGNNVASSLAIATGLTGMQLIVSAPAGYELDAAFLAEVKQRIPETHVDFLADPAEAVREADIVYTDVWTSMGQESQKEQRQKIFAPYQVNEALMAQAPPDCRFMHDLPARRGKEVTDGVLDGPQSIAFTQAENRMHLAKGLLLWLLEADAS